ncbi:MAG: polymer-forming cytoskeletal protein [Acidimicrobiia bacterium]
MTSSTPRRLFGITLIALAALPLVLGSLRVTGRIIVPVGDVLDEDLYAIGNLVSIEGTVRGDVFAMSSELRISGTVEGDVIALVGGRTDISGRVDGAVRVAGIRLEIDGSIGDDLAAFVIESDVAGSVGRDVLLIGGEVSISGSVGRDLRLQAIRLGIDGDIGGDILAKVDTLTFGSGTRVLGDVLYRASRDAAVSDDAVIGGQFIRRTVLAPVWAKAVTRVVSVLSLFALIVAGLAASWLFRSTSERAVREVEERPLRSGLVGLGILVAPPLLAMPLFLTLVGIPVAVFVLLAWLLALVLGPIPAVTHFGAVLLRDRGGVAAALVVGAVVWRGAMWLLPLIAALVYLAAVLVGLGAYATAGWSLRREI